MLSRRFGYSYKTKTAFPFPFKVSFVNKSNLLQRQQQCYHICFGGKSGGLTGHSDGLKNRARLQTFFGEVRKNNVNGHYRVDFYAYHRCYASVRNKTKVVNSTKTTESLKKKTKADSSSISNKTATKIPIKEKVSKSNTTITKGPRKNQVATDKESANVESDANHELIENNTKSDDSTNTEADVKGTSSSLIGSDASSEVSASEEIAEGKLDASPVTKDSSNEASAEKIELKDNSIDSNPQNYSAKNDSIHKEFISETDESRVNITDHPTTSEEAKTEASVDDDTTKENINSIQNSSIKDGSNNDNMVVENLSCNEPTSIDDSSKNDVPTKISSSADTKPSEIIVVDAKTIESNQRSIGSGEIHLSDSQLEKILGPLRQLNENSARIANYLRQLNEIHSLCLSILCACSQAIIDVTKDEKASKQSKEGDSNEINKDLDISEFKNFCEKINATEGTLKKFETIREHPEFKNILIQILNNKKPFYVKSVKLKKFIDKFEPNELKIMLENATEYPTIYSLFDALSTKQITGNTGRLAIERYIREKCNSPELREFFNKILDKKLNINIASKNMNRIFGANTIPLFSVALGQELPESNFDKLFPESQESSGIKWFVSRKYDGVRCIVQYYPNSKEIKISSRLGNPFTALKDLEERIKSLMNQNQDLISKNTIWESGLVLDGEICVFDEEVKDREKFLSALEVRKVNDYQMKNFQYLVFDCLTEEEFTKMSGIRNYQERLDFLNKLLPDDKKEDLGMISIIKQNILESKQSLEKQWENAKAKNWEGLMLRKNVGYQGKRSSDLLKVKGRKDAEYTVKDIEIGPMKIDGVEYKDVLRSVVIEHRHGNKLNKVHVGSGLTNEDRLKYRTPRSIIGKEVTVEYTDESKTQKKNGKGECETVTSLRFPRIKAIYEKKRDV
ncbi:12680_t:CDS:2 [Ambispora leptoticha]|uniref:12680_t:CDS:1 n=1 Tax=Ambispora leptoticha TaxID=144679 RepID=A0A9N9FH72_9GLOM|nr:12680_t:CDS:2 [Ambispora leptoticha]